PQGQPTRTGALTRVYDAAALMAARCNARIVPVRISGTLYSRFSAVSGQFPKRLFPRVTLTILPPRELPQPEHAAARARRRRLADGRRQIMQDMMFESRPRTTLLEAYLYAAALHGPSTRIMEDTQGEHTYRNLIRATLALGRLSSRLSE